MSHWQEQTVDQETSSVLTPAPLWMRRNVKQPTSNSAKQSQIKSVRRFMTLNVRLLMRNNAGKCEKIFWFAIKLITSISIKQVKPIFFSGLTMTKSVKPNMKKNAKLFMIQLMNRLICFCPTNFVAMFWW